MAEEGDPLTRAAADEDRKEKKKRGALVWFNAGIVIRFVLYLAALCMAVLIPGILMLGENAACITQDSYRIAHVVFWFMVVAIIVGMTLGTLLCAMGPHFGAVGAKLSWLFLVASGLLVLIYLASLVTHIVEVATVAYPCSIGTAIAWIGLITAIVLIVLECISFAVAVYMSKTPESPATAGGTARELPSYALVTPLSEVTSDAQVGDSSVVFPTSRDHFLRRLLHTGLPLGHRATNTSTA